MSTGSRGDSADTAAEGPEGSSERLPLNRDRVLRAGVEFADRHGIAKLSMRKLATSVGFEVMSLYNHVANKNDLLEGMAELVAAEIDDPTDEPDWRVGTARVARSTNAALLRHPWAIDLFTTAFPGPNRFRYMENLLGFLAQGGFAGELGDLGFHALNHHIVGFSRQQVAYHFDDEEWAALDGRFEREVDPETFPLLVAHKAYHDRVDQGRAVAPDQFGFVLDLLLDGLERTRDAGLGATGVTE